MEAILFIGIQATGKSTFFKRRFFDSHVRISLDVVRTRHRERSLLETCLKTTQRFVVDNTNPTREDRKRYVGPARDAGFRVVGYYFQSRIDEALMRNTGRSGSGRIPEKGIRGTHARLVLPDYSEGFDALYYVSLRDDGSFSIVEWQNDV